MLIRSPTELAAYIKERRKNQKISQQEAASLVGLKQKTVSSFENNPDSTKLDTLFRILSATNIELHVQQKGEKPKSPWQEEW